MQVDPTAYLEPVVDPTPSYETLSHEASSQETQAPENGPVDIEEELLKIHNVPQIPSLLKSITSKHKIIFDITDYEYEADIHAIFNGELIIDISSDNGVLLNAMGTYYTNIIYNLELGLRYYIVAAEKYNNRIAFNNIGVYYYNKHDYEMAVSYYLKAVAMDSGVAMYNMFTYYNSIVNEYDTADEYFHTHIHI